jgi:alpha-tubulin suppressor-like RCC1 family protein
LWTDSACYGFLPCALGLRRADAAIAFGTKHAIALRTNGDVLTWGDNVGCQLGRPVTARTLGNPDLVMRNAKEIAAASEHNLVLTNDGKVYGWGMNPEGALGVGDLYDKCEGPVLVRSLADKVITHISTGHGFSVAVTSTGDLYCAGDNSMGQCPAAKTGRLETFALVPLPEIGGKVAEVRAGAFHVLVLTKDNRLYAFGRGRDGQLGNGKTANGAGYVQDLAGVVSFGAGIWHSVALTKDGAVWVWGNNSKSQLCDGATTNRAVPAKVDPLPGTVTRVVAGAHGTALLTSDGGMFVCGDNQSGSLGLDALATVGRPTKVPVPAIKNGILALGGNDAAFSPDGCSIRDGRLQRQRDHHVHRQRGVARVRRARVADALRRGIGDAPAGRCPRGAERRRVGVLGGAGRGESVHEREMGAASSGAPHRRRHPAEERGVDGGARAGAHAPDARGPGRWTRAARSST